MNSDKSVYKLEDLKFEALLDQKFTRKDVDLIDAYITYVADAKLISKITVELCRIYSFSGRFHYLKRIHRLNDKIRFLIGPIDSIDTDELKINLNKLDLSEYECIKIPNNKPLTRSQLDYCNQFWPCNFFEYKNVEKCLAGTNLFDTETFVEINLNRLIELAKNNGRCATIIAKKDEIITQSISATDEHFLHHSAFRAINKTSEDQLKFIEQNSKNNIVMKDSKPIILPYLCTTYDVYMTNEPCVICAMALLHSRIKRLFYLGDFHQFDLKIDQIDCMNDHAITGLRIHTHQSLNHHFEVFKVNLKDKKTDLM